MEFFADLFAAQYVGSLIVKYLNYIAPSDKDSYTHPSTKSRIEVVTDWLDGNKNNKVKEIETAISKTVNNHLKNRFREINSNSFEKFIPHKVLNVLELHGIYSYGWKLWVERKKIFKGYEDDKVFTILNNLIEKSLSNYMVQEIWNDVNSI